MACACQNQAAGPMSYQCARTQRPPALRGLSTAPRHVRKQRVDSLNLYQQSFPIRCGSPTGHVQTRSLVMPSSCMRARAASRDLQGDILYSCRQRHARVCLGSEAEGVSGHFWSCPYLFPLRVAHCRTSAACEHQIQLSSFSTGYQCQQRPSSLGERVTQCFI